MVIKQTLVVSMYDDDRGEVFQTVSHFYLHIFFALLEFELQSGLTPVPSAQCGLFGEEGRLIAV